MMCIFQICMSKIKVSFFFPNFAFGGAERTTVQIANGLAARGYRTDLVVLKAEGPYLQEVSPDVHVFAFNISRARYSIWPLVRYLRQHRPDIVFSTLMNAPLILANYLAGSPCRVVLSERSLFSSIKKTARSFSQRLTFWASGYLNKKADAIVSVSQASADDLRRSALAREGQIRVIYNPVVTPELECLMSAEPNHEWVKEKKVPVVLAVGRLAPEKNYDVLCRAFAQISEDARLIILGEGPERKKLETLTQSLGIAERVSMPGFVGNPFSCMARADVFVLCSRFEGLPGALIQAMACGLTPVVTDSPGGLAEVLGDSLRDYLVPSHDPEALSNAIGRALQHPLPPERLRERAMVFSERASIDAYVNLIDEILNKA